MDMDKHKPGQSAELVVEVTREMTTNRTGREGADVLSTPALLELMENASIEVSDPFLTDEYTTVGFAVDGLRHIAPTSIGQKVRVKSVLTEVDRNRLTYSIEAFEGDTKIGLATHKRAVIPKDPGPS
ncbi:MAG: thioesterase family protein [Chloroflexi bacterium]|nr:thioesterase family protein [Chloroflexota bacterium]